MGLTTNFGPLVSSCCLAFCDPPVQTRRKRHGGGRRTKNLQGEGEKRKGGKKGKKEKEKREEKKERKGEESKRERCTMSVGVKQPLLTVKRL